MITVSGFSLAAVWGAVPAHIRDNHAELAALVGAEKAQGIVATTGFPKRRCVAPGASVFDLMLPAAQKALAGRAPEEIGGVVAVSFSAPERFPALSIRLQDALHLPQSCAALDLNLACSGYPYGVMVAGQLVAATGKCVLLVDGDVQSAFVDQTDVSTRAVMSDAATATLLVPRDTTAQFAFRTAGAQGSILNCPAAGPIHMDGFGVFRFVAKDVTAFLQGFQRVLPSSPAYFIPHQANMYMVRQLAKALNLEKGLLTSGETYANPGSCSVPLTLAANPLPAHAPLLMAAFGAGLSAAACYLTLPPAFQQGVVEVEV